MASQSTARVPEIWIGYTKHGHHYLDKQPKAANTEQQLRALQNYFHQRFTSTERFVSRWIYCQKPIIQVGELNAAYRNGLEERLFPHEVQFEELREWAALSASFSQPETLRESGRQFHDINSFDVGLVDLQSKKVLYVGYAFHKRHLMGPIMFSFLIAVLVPALVVGISKRSTSLGAEVAGFFGILIALLWAYIFWFLG